MTSLRERLLHRLQWTWERSRRRMKTGVMQLWQRFFPLQLPRTPDGQVWIHLGCGDLDLPGFINVDARAAPHVHIVGDVGDLSRFAEETVDLVYGSHVLEHIAPRRVPGVLWEWRRVLKPGGILRLSVPDLERIIELYTLSGGNAEIIQAPLFGQQDYPENLHRAVYDRSRLAHLLLAAGFTTVRPWSPGDGPLPAIPDCSSLRISCAGGPVFISLNLEAVR
ncbi:MAG: methyltransferase domain-containing protein [Magnetococcales bacterium]|nr:methyltransferase domain-containing protein [Magnetococcales bacterium]